MPFGTIGHYIESFLNSDDNYDDNLIEHNYESDDRGDSSNSHEYSFSDKKTSSSLSAERKSYRPVKGTAAREEDDRSKDDLLADWSHELATK